MPSVAALLAPLADLLRSALPLALAWLAGRRGAEAASSNRTTEILDAQRDIAARPDAGADALRERMRDGTL
ncbi:MAG: hypothetical protein OHK0024_36780 [Thalassobaculales bacterium]